MGAEVVCRQFLEVVCRQLSWFQFCTLNESTLKHAADSTWKQFLFSQKLNAT